MTIQHLFATPFYTGALDDPALLADLAHSCRSLAADDAAGRRWSRDNHYPGYTSYAALDDLPSRDPAFAALVRRLAPHVLAFAAAAHLDIAGRKPKLDSLWVNILRPGGSHSGHIHPHSIISGTVYIEVPDGAGALKLEDPRLPMLMAAPARTPDAPETARPFVYMAPAAGHIFLWESWLRHEVVPGRAKGERISISFNYR
ncbi:TIGR02466 family protein [Sandarakinorhabdus sp.]|uniref:TIGR02466 family protein n=1 Tax=Sandarakinorhabdus sp. TaxID=1916663 RepID=UPI00286EA553|nr:TIGR02466 family protein [Sandarakinorhabdus sp.]